MKSRLPIFAAMTSIAIGLPLQAQTAQMMNRTEIISVIAVAQCHINAGRLTEEQANQIVREIVQEKPHLKAASLWALNSDNARAARDSMAPTLGPNCNGEVTDELVENVIIPNLN